MLNLLSYAAHKQTNQLINEQKTIALSK